MLLEAINYFLYNNTIFLGHILNLFVLVLLIVLLIFTRRNKDKWTKLDDYLGVLTKTVNSVRYGDLTKQIDTKNLPISEKLGKSLNRMIETLSDREKMVFEYQTELNRQNKLLEAVINSLSDGLVIIDENYKILRATKKISEWFNTEGNNLLHKDITHYIKIEDKKRIENLQNSEIRIDSASSLDFIASCIELNLEDKKKRFIIIIQNITNRKEIETLKEDFVATLTHDLKVPIIAETNMLELFLNENFGAISDKQRFALKNMKASNKELLNLVQTVLETYKVRDGKIKLYKEDILLKSFIEEIIAEINPIATKTGNTIVFKQSREIRVYADRMQLRRVIKNFIQNAISYGDPNSPIEISIGEIPQYIIIKIKDYGSGISKQEIEKIFNKYYSAARKFRKIGTGLGLYLASQIIKSHNGDVIVDSEEGKYTEFTIKLPAVMNINLHYGE